MNRTGSRKRGRHALKTGHENELETIGGEVQFVSELLKWSEKRIKIFSSVMLGCKSSILPLTEVARSHQCNTHVEELKQGRTSRWVFCWSFIDNFFSETLESNSDKSYSQVINMLQDFLVHVFCCLYAKGFDPNPSVIDGGSSPLLVVMNFG